VLGVASHSVLYELSSALTQGDAARCLGIVSELANQGYDIAHVTRDLLALLRNLVVAKVVKEPESLLDLPDEESGDVKRLAQSADADDLTRLYHGFSQGFDDVVRSERPRAALEMLLVRLARRPALLPIDDLVSRLSALERRLSGGGSPQQRPPPRASQDLPPRTEKPPAASQSAALDQQQGSGSRPRDPRSPPPSRKADGDDRGGEPPVVGPAPHPSASPSSANANADRLPRAAQAQSVEELDRVYQTVLALLEVDRPDLASMLGHAIPLELTPTSVVVGWHPDGVLVASDRESVSALAKAAEKHFGCPVAVTFEFESERARGRKSLATADTQERAEKTRQAYASAQKHERITEAVEILGAKLKELKLGGAA